MDTACFGGKKSGKRWKKKNGASLNHRQTDPSVRQWFEWGIVLGIPFIN